MAQMKRPGLDLVLLGPPVNRFSAPSASPSAKRLSKTKISPPHPPCHLKSFVLVTMDGLHFVCFSFGVYIILGRHVN